MSLKSYLNILHIDIGSNFPHPTSNSGEGVRGALINDNIEALLKGIHLS